MLPGKMSRKRWWAGIIWVANSRKASKSCALSCECASILENWQFKLCEKVECKAGESIESLIRKKPYVP
jgi:hypothetical protein